MDSQLQKGSIDPQKKKKKPAKTSVSFIPRRGSARNPTRRYVDGGDVRLSMRVIQIAIRHSLRFEIQIPRFLLAPFSCLSSSSYADPRVSSSDFEGEKEEGNSAVYRHKLKFQRPSTVPWRREWWNSASFIGTVAQPLKILESGAVYTVLSVPESSQSKGGFR